MSFFRGLAFWLVALAFAIPVAAQDFGSFKRDELSAPGTAAKVKDPTGSAPAKPVYGFTLPAGYCNPKPYDPGGAESDCTFRSSRSQMFETKKSQPAEAWYGVHVYFPKSFPIGGAQTRGHYEFFYWHNRQCPHLTFASDAGGSDQLYLQGNRALGNFDCEPTAKRPIISMKKLLGRWTKFETFVRWSSGSDGRVEVYVDGKLVLAEDGPTLVAGYETVNYFKFGVYLCCTKDVGLIKEGSVYYAGVSRAKTRDGLK